MGLVLPWTSQTRELVSSDSSPPLAPVKRHVANLTWPPRPAHAFLMNDRTDKDDSELGILARRRIEAAIIAPIYDEMRQAIGEEKARDILRRAIRRAAIDAGAEMATRADGEADLA